jgi:hypothetical protein
LGWFRLDERGQPFVQSGEVFLDKLHHARVDDCAEQRFRSVLDASYYVNADNNVSLDIPEKNSYIAENKAKIIILI